MQGTDWELRAWYLELLGCSDAPCGGQASWRDSGYIRTCSSGDFNSLSELDSERYKVKYTAVA